MVLIAGAVCTRQGKALVSRQFVEMSKSRIEGLLAAFPKLVTSGSSSGSSKQHTFIETDSVRYVYQPMEKLYMVLITTKNSNILEDLETLRLFARVIPEYCRTMDESNILDNAFNLIFAFDEIVALGYRESVNMGQIRTYVEMDSHDEKVFEAVRQTQERDAKQKMREKAKELQRLKMEASRSGGVQYGSGISISSNNSISSNITHIDSYAQSDGMHHGMRSADMETSSPSKSSYRSASSSTGGGKLKSGMKLGSASSMSSNIKGGMGGGGKSSGRDVEAFVNQLKSEGETVRDDQTLDRQLARGGVSSSNNVSLAAKSATSSAVSSLPPVSEREAVHMKVEEKLNAVCRRDGGLDSLEISGILQLHITDSNFNRIVIQMENASADVGNVQLQPHPNVDKEMLKSQQKIGLKNASKTFPNNTDVGVLKWRMQGQDGSKLPISINCWPSDNGEGGFDVNIEYQLEQNHLQLHDVVILVPLPEPTGGKGSSPPPVVSECDGSYEFDRRSNCLVWQIPIIDEKNSNGTLEFTASSSNEDDFFPVRVTFASRTPYCGIKVVGCTDLSQDGVNCKFSTEKIFTTEKFEVL